MLGFEPALQPSWANPAAMTAQVKPASSRVRDILPICRSRGSFGPGSPDWPSMRMLTLLLPERRFHLCSSRHRIRSHIDAINYIPVAIYLQLLQDFTFLEGFRFRRFSGGVVCAAPASRQPEGRAEPALSEVEGMPANSRQDAGAT